MPILHAVVLGIVQGLTEFLPVSSSGHLEITRWLLGWDELSADTETAFDVAVHLGTLCGAIAYLRRDVVRYTTAGVAPLLGRGPLGGDGRIAWTLVVSALPAGVVGLVAGDVISSWSEGSPARAVAVVAVMLIGFGIVLLLADLGPERRGSDDFGLLDGLLLGSAQVLALQPGVSRSGIVISAARGLGYERSAATRLAFLMSLPVIAGAALYQFSSSSIPASFWAPFLAGVLASAVTGWLAVWATLQVVARSGLRPFVGYRLILGAVVLTAVASGV